jgi:phosphate-selective porin OprO/OprP
VGVNYSHQFLSDAASFSYSQRPEAHLAPKIVNTGNIADVSGANLVGGELAGVFGPVSFQSEIISSFLDRSQGRSNPTFWGTYGQVSWFLTGERRNYATRDAAFTRVSPKHNFSIKDGTWGGLELAARYSYLSLDDKGVPGGIASDITGGINWYLFPNLRLMFNYIYSDQHELGNASIAQTRIQVDF